MVISTKMGSLKGVGVVGGWWLATNDRAGVERIRNRIARGQLVSYLFIARAVDWWLVVGGRWLVVNGWWLVVGDGGWWSVVGGGWWLVVGG